MKTQAYLTETMSSGKYRILGLLFAIALLVGCTQVRSIHTGPGQPTSYYVKCFGDMGNCLDRGTELCPGGYNVTSTNMAGDWNSAIIACRVNDVPLR